jgi:hypothetical protein
MEQGTVKVAGRKGFRILEKSKETHEMKRFTLSMMAVGAAFFLLGVCIKSVSMELGAKKGDGLGGGVHYDIPHCKGTVQEDSVGCPCLCLKMGYSSYANMTNAIAHGYTNSIYDLYRDMLVRPAITGDVVHLIDVYRFEKQLMEEINVTGRREDGKIRQGR